MDNKIEELFVPYSYCSDPQEMADNSKNFFKKYRFLIVMVPGIVLIHVLWLKLQSDPVLMRNADKEKSKLPFTVIYERWKNSAYKKLNSSEKESSQNKD